MFSFLKKIIFTVIAVALLLFLYQNMEALSQTIGFKIDLYAEGLSYDSPQFPVFFMFLGAFLLGTMIIGFHGFYERIARKAELKLRDRRIKSLEKELASLKKERLAVDGAAAKELDREPAKDAGEDSASKIIDAPGTAKEVPVEPAAPLEEEPTL